MKLHLVTIGKPKLDYARLGWEEYTNRLARMHTVRLTTVADKYAYDTDRLLGATTGTYRVALVIDGPMHTSHQLADFLQSRAIAGQEISFVIGGPDGLPAEFIADCQQTWSFSPLTFPHDLAMVVLAEALYRASAINAGLPYHH